MASALGRKASRSKIAFQSTKNDVPVVPNLAPALFVSLRELFGHGKSRMDRIVLKLGIDGQLLKMGDGGAGVE